MTDLVNGIEAKM